jgi:signal transduction histidine kinase
MGALMRTIDWSKTSIGPVSSWPGSLRTTLATLLANRFATLLWWGPDLIQLYNDAYRPILGEKHPASMGARARDVWGEIWHIIGPLAERVIGGGPAVLAEHLLLPMNRRGFVEETYFTFSYSPVKDERGAIGGVLVTVQETTEQVQAARQLSLLRDLATTTTGRTSAEDAARSGAAVLANDPRDFPFALIYLSDGAGRRLVAQTGIAHGAPIEAFAWPFEEALHTGREVVVEPLAVHTEATDGDPPTEVRRAAVLPLQRASGNEAYGYLVAGLHPGRLLDERYRELLRLTADHFVKAMAAGSVFEEERRRAEALAEIDRAKTAFFSNVSHEFRTPLTLLLGPVEEAMRGADRTLGGEALELVHRNALRLLKLVNTLLDFSRMEAGRVQASFEATDLAALTADLASAFRSAMERAGLSFRVEADELSEGVYVDRDMWEKIVLNLLSNALKHTFQGGVSVTLRDVGDHVTLDVADTGVGIPEQDLERVFERFHRVEQTRARTHEGSGIGLALVRDLVRLHGGTIRVSSHVPGGTTFTVTLPKGRAHLPPEHVTEASRPRNPARAEAYVGEALRWLDEAGVEGEPVRIVAARSAEDGPRPRILVADDNADMRQYIERLLREHWDVTSVADGEAALAAVRAERPDLVLSDVMMPRLDGFELVRELKSSPETCALPVILLSARAGEEDAAAGLRSGADDYLVKPFSGSALLVRVEAALMATRAREGARRAAQKERQRLYSMLMDGPAALCLLTGNALVVEFANPRCLDLWGKGPSVIGKPLLEALPELAGQAFVRLLHDVMRTGKAYHAEQTPARLERAGKLEDVFFNFVYTPARNEADEIDGVFSFGYEVTHLVEARAAAERASREAEAARREAESANRIKDEFLATMSHELRTPLNAILGWASLLRTGDQDGDLKDKALATIERNAQAQARLIDDILDVSRIVSGKLRIEVRPIAFAGVVHAAIDVVRPAAAAKQIDLHVAVGADIGPIPGDADRLQQVVWNLLSNAVRFTPERGQITVAARREAGFVELSVQDSGIGIGAKHLPYVFERFRQVDSTTTRRYGGLGLGLAIVRHLVELHGGSVEVSSPGEGCGATFRVRLPTHAPPRIDASGNASNGAKASDANADERHLEGLRIVVTDDDDDSRDLIAMTLQEGGARVATASSAEAAFELIRMEPPDLLISDIGMPDEDGFSLMRRVRALPRESGGDVPALALTAYAREEDARHALAVGFDEHLRKPIAPDALVAAAHRVAKRNGARA